MAKKILVVEDEPISARIVSYALEKEGYQVSTASNGLEGLIKVGEERPDLLIVDMMMPELDGLGMLHALRQNPETQAIPAIMLTSISAVEGEPRVMDLGVDHYLDKPVDPDLLKATVRIVLRQYAVMDVERGDKSKVDTTSTPGVNPSQKESEPPPAISTGIEMLDENLGEGLSPHSLTMVEGTAASGKSVLCQHIAHGALLSGHQVAYFSTEHNDESFIARMHALGLNVADQVSAERMRICPITETSPYESPADSVALLLKEMDRVPPEFDLILVDSITSLAAYSEERAIIGFFQSCRGVCKRGRTVVIVADSAIFDEKMFARLRSVLDTHIQLSNKTMARKFVKTVTVLKVNNMEIHTESSIPFDVHPDRGIVPIPILQFSV